MESCTEVSNRVGFACVGVLLVFLIFSSVASAQDGSLRSMRLLAPETGWALTDRLFWTTDGGSHWKDITPRIKLPQIVAVFFLDTSTGWMLLARTTDDALLGFDLASTVDSGVNWTVTPIRMSSTTNFSTWGNSAGLEFVDALHGWILFSAGARASSLFVTEDGGKAWHSVSASGLSEEGVYGPFHFVNTRDGWLTNGYWLYNTHDGGNTWQELSLKAPPQASPAMKPAYDIPTFGDSQHGVLPVTYSIAYSVPQPHSAFVLFATDDGGRTWKVQRVISNLKSMAPGTTFPSSVTGSDVIAATSRDGRRLTLMNGTTGTIGDVGRSVSQLRFVDIARGWTMTTDGYLFSTNDAGATWADITPAPKTHTATNQATIMPSSIFKPLETFSATLTAGTASVSRHLGFDEFSVAPLTPNLATWWKDSPYFDLGFYLNGAYTHSSQDTLLSPGWVSGAMTQGWGLWPHWEDYQAPCDTYTHKINPASANSYAAARAQGKKSADCAALSAGGIAVEGTGACKRPTCSGNACSPGIVPTKGLRLAGHIIYYDLEGYTPSALVTDPTTKTQVACGASVNAFLDGWITEIHNKGFLAGIYGNPAAATSWHQGSSTYSAVSPFPEDVWIAAYSIPNLPGRATVWGLGFNDTYWKTNQRIHQYSNTHNETWGSYTISLDNDIEDAQVLAGNGVKQYTFAFQQFDCFSDTRAHAINSVGQVVGYYTDKLGTDHGYLDTKGLCITIDPQGSTASRALGINNVGNIVGYWEDIFGNRRGYEYSSKKAAFITTTINCGTSLTTVSGINDDEQMVGHYVDSDSNKHAFIYIKGKCHSFDYNGASGYTIATGINGSAQVVGYYGDLSGNSHGFIYYPLPPNWVGNFDSRLIDCPDLGSISTDPQGINNQGQVVGYWHSTDGTVQGFFYNGGLCKLISQSSGETEAYGIRDDTTIVGAYPDSSGAFHGFTGEVPH